MQYCDIHFNQYQWFIGEGRTPCVKLPCLFLNFFFFFGETLIIVLDNLEIKGHAGALLPYKETCVTHAAAVFT